MAGALLAVLLIRGPSSSLPPLPEPLTPFPVSGSRAEIRSWLRTNGPRAAESVALGLDNRNDPNGRARIGILDAIASLRHENLVAAEAALWGGTLQRLALKLLHEGSEQEEFRAQGRGMVTSETRAPASLSR